MRRLLTVLLPGSVLFACSASQTPYSTEVHKTPFVTNLKQVTSDNPAEVCHSPSTNATILGFEARPAAEQRVKCAWELAERVIASQSFKTELQKLLAAGAPDVQAGYAAKFNSQCPAERKTCASQKITIQGVRPYWPRIGFATATTNLGSDLIELRRWRVWDPLPDLAGTLVHEWLHTIGFVDPDTVGDVKSVVYGSEAAVRLMIIAEMPTQPPTAASTSP